MGLSTPHPSLRVYEQSAYEAMQTSAREARVVTLKWSDSLETDLEFECDAVATRPETDEDYALTEYKGTDGDGRSWRVHLVHKGED